MKFRKYVINVATPAPAISHRKIYTMMCAQRKCKLEVATMIHMTTPAPPMEFKYYLLASNYEWQSIAGISILT